MKPYFDEDGITIYHADAREIIPHVHAETVFTDPPWGIGLTTQRPPKMRKHNVTTYAFTDDEQYVVDVCVPIIQQCIARFTRVVLTSGSRHAFHYPKPTTIWAIHWPNGAGRGPWSAFNCWQPILLYGTGPKRIGSIPDTFVTTEQADANGHPCPKPLRLWERILDAISNPDDTILDPFMGSGTTLQAAYEHGQRAIGIDLDERWCEVAAKRLAQRRLPLGNKIVDTSQPSMFPPYGDEGDP